MNTRSDAEALLRQGIELYDLGRFQEAIVMFDRGIALYPRLAKAHYFKGIALYDLGKFNEAIAAYDEASLLEPTDPNTLYNKAATLAQIGRNEEALETCDRLLSLKVDNAEGWILKGIAL